MHARQILLHVVKPVLEQMAPEIQYSNAALRLVFGTGLHESGNFSYLEQYLGSHDVTLGPAFGIFQCERATVDDIYNNFLSAKRFTGLKAKLQTFFAENPNDRMHQIAGNMFAATAVCRVHYYRVRTPLPKEDDLTGLANYWKQYYNSLQGKGRPSQFIEAVEKYEAKFGPIIAP
jgi:hypothetical protein